MDSKSNDRIDIKEQNNLFSFKSMVTATVFLLLGLLAKPAYQIATKQTPLSAHKEVAKSNKGIQKSVKRKKIISCSNESLQDFLHAEPLRGFHIFCFEKDKSVSKETGATTSKYKVTVYGEATASSKVSWEPEQYTWDSFEEKFLSVMTFKGVKDPRWAFFTSDGVRLVDVKQIQQYRSPQLKSYMLHEIASCKMVFLIEGGTWLWPGVRVGFKRQIAINSSTSGSNGESHTDQVATLETLSIDPLVLSVEGFLSSKECVYIQEVARPKVQHASGVSLMDADAEKEAADFRTSQSAFIDSENDLILRDFEDRTSQLTRTPLENQELYQILKYSLGQKYDAHLDYFDISQYRNDESIKHLTKNGTQNRFATVFFYLSDVEKGGETIFPRFNKGPHPRDMTDCTKGLKVKPQKGKVIIFYSLYPTGEYNAYSLHGACPVEEGIKWAGNKWIWNAPINFISRR